MTLGDRIRYQLPQCAPTEATIVGVHAGGKTFATMGDNHPQSLPPIWVAASQCEKAAPHDDERADHLTPEGGGTSA